MIRDALPAVAIVRAWSARGRRRCGGPRRPAATSRWLAASGWQDAGCQHVGRQQKVGREAVDVDCFSILQADAAGRCALRSAMSLE